MSSPDPHDTLRSQAVAVVSRLQQAGHTTYWAGGSVRDMLLGHRPADYDIATRAAPDAVLALFPHALAVGKSFGVVRVRMDEDWFEVATFRTDHGYADGRHPTAVSYTDARGDAERRDFTINGMFYDPITDELHDYVGGQTDLEARLVRCVGDPQARFEEDHLRMLRAVRFTSVLGFTLHQPTADAIRAMAPRILAISPERIGDEITRLLVESARAGTALELLDAVGLLAPILPEIKAMQGQAQPEQFHPEGDVFEHTMAMLNMVEGRDKLLTFAVLLHDVGKPGTARVTPERIRFDGHAALGAEMSRSLLRRLRFSNKEQDTITKCVHDHMRFMDVRHMRPATLRRMIGAPAFPTELELHRLDCLASHGSLENYEFVRQFQASVKDEPVLPAPWLSGHDIMALGVPKGPEVGRWRTAAYEAQLNGEVASADELRAWVEAKLERD